MVRLRPIANAWPRCVDACGAAIRLVSLGGVALLVSCGDAIEPDKVPSSTGNEVLDQRQGASFGVRVPGAWRPKDGSGGISVDFWPPNGPAILEISCDEGGGLLIDRLHLDPVVEPRLMVVQSGQEVARLATKEIAAVNHVLRAAVPADHPLVREMKNSTQVSFQIEPGPWVTLPLGPLVNEQITRCEKLELSG